MSTGTTIKWRPVEQTGAPIPTDPGAAITLRIALENAFRTQLPIIMGKEAVPMLDGMAALFNTYHPDTSNPYDHLINAIVENGTVEVFAETKA